MGTSWETLPVLDFVRLDARDIGPGPGTTPVRSGHEHVADLSSLCRVLSHGTRERGRRVETRAAGEARRQGRTTKFGEVVVDAYVQVYESFTVDALNLSQPHTLRPGAGNERTHA